MPAVRGSAMTATMFCGLQETSRHPAVHTESLGDPERETVRLGEPSRVLEQPLSATPSRWSSTPASALSTTSSRPTS